MEKTAEKIYKEVAGNHKGPGKRLSEPLSGKCKKQNCDAFEAETLEYLTTIFGMTALASATQFAWRRRRLGST